jgi:hypothetical protein
MACWHWDDSDKRFFLLFIPRLTRVSLLESKAGLMLDNQLADTWNQPSSHLWSMVPATNFCKVSDFSEPIEPCWEWNRTCQPDPGKGVKHQSLAWARGCRGLGLNARPPVRELARWTTRPHRRPKALRYFCLWCVSISLIHCWGSLG